MGERPGKNHHQKKGKFEKLDDFYLGVIKRIIHCFYLRSEPPTIAKILAELKRKMDFPYKNSHLHSLLMKLASDLRDGRWRESFMRDDLVSWREKYLRETAKVRETEIKRKIVCMDETWLNEGHRLQKEFVDLVTLNKANRKLLYKEGLTVGCTKAQVGKENASLLPMQWMQNGPVDSGLWIFKAETKKKKRKTEDLSSKNGKQKSVEKDHGSNSEDETKEVGLLFEEHYHNSMNAKNFEKYFASLCEKLPKNTVIVIDNASYHSRKY